MKTLRHGGRGFRGNLATLSLLVCLATTLAAAASDDPPPALRVTRVSGSELRLAWPAAARDFVLEQARHLGSIDPWSRVAASPSTVGEELAVSIPVTGQVQYFRLRYRPDALFATDTAVLLALANPGSTVVVAGEAFVVDVRASLNATMAATAFRVSASGTANALLTGRSANPAENNGMAYLSSTSQWPFESGLPATLADGGATEVLLSTGEWPRDGVPPGEEVVLETLEITPGGSGALTISLSAPEAVTSRWARDGRPFQTVMLDPWRSALTVQVQPGTPAPSAVPPGPLPAGVEPRPQAIGTVAPNADGMGEVNWADLVFVRARLGMDPAGVGNRGADVNGDGKIDLLDLVAVRNRLSPDPAMAGRPEVRLNEVMVQPADGQAPWIELQCTRPADGAIGPLELRNRSEQVLVAAGGEPIPAWLPYIVVVFDGPKPREIITEPGKPGLVRLHVPNPGRVFDATNDQCRLFVDGQLVDAVAWSPEPERNASLNTRLFPIPVGGSVGRDGLEGWRWVRFGHATPGADNRLPTPLAMSPFDGSGILRRETTQFTWVDPRYSAVAYELEIDAAPDFATPLVRATCHTSAYSHAPGLPGGRYFWRLRVQAGEEAGPWSAPAAFEVMDVVPTSRSAGWALQSGAARPHVDPPPPSSFVISWFERHQVLGPRKDTTLICMECEEETGLHPWDRPHGSSKDIEANAVGLCLHELGHAATAVAVTLNHFYGGDLTQDEVNLAVFTGNGPTVQPEGSLGHGRKSELHLTLPVAGGVLDLGAPGSADPDSALYYEGLRRLISAGTPLVTDMHVRQGQAGGSYLGPVVIYGYLSGKDVDGGEITQVIAAGPFIGQGVVIPQNSLYGSPHYYYLGEITGNVEESDRDLHLDTDGDGLCDLDEWNRFGTDGRKADSDGDGIKDKTEVRSYKFGKGWAARAPDSDGDGERAETDPDSDNDGCPDGVEDRNHNGTLFSYTIYQSLEPGSSAFPLKSKDADETDPFSVDEFKLKLTADTNRVHFGECTRLAVTVTDRADEPVEQAYVRITLAPSIASLGASGGAPVTTAFAFTDNNGQASMEFCALETPGAVTVEASYKPCSNGRESKAELQITILGYDWIFAVQEKAVLTGPLQKGEYVVRSPATGLLTGRQLAYHDCGHQKATGYFAHPTAKEPGRSIDYIAVQFAPTVELLIDGEAVPNLTWVRTNALQAPVRWEVRMTWDAGNHSLTPPRYLEVGAGGAAGRRTPLLWWGGCEVATERRRVYDGNAVGDPPQERVLSIDYANVRVHFLFGDGNSAYYDWVFTWPGEIHTGVSFIPIGAIDGHKPGTYVLSDAPITPSGATADSGTYYRYEIFNWDKAVADYSPETQWSILRAPKFDYAELERGLREAGPMSPPPLPTDIRFLRDYIGAELKELQERKLNAPQYEIRMLTGE